jgi:hypothetical protein
MRRRVAQKRAADVRLIRGLRHDRHVAASEIRESDVRDAFLRPDERHDLGDGIESLPETRRHPIADRLTKWDVAETETVPSHRRGMRGFHQRFHRRGRRREVGIAGTQVDDVDAALEKLALACGHVRERIHREGLEAIGELGQFILRAVLKWRVMVKYAPSSYPAHSAVTDGPHTVWHNDFAVPTLCPTCATS